MPSGTVKVVRRISWHVFFSSRRRHTSYWRDWSSDVCSSDLEMPMEINPVQNPVALFEEWLAEEIGRASCRERVETEADAATTNKTRSNSGRCASQAARPAGASAASRTSTSHCA